MSRDRSYYISHDNGRCGYEWDVSILNGEYESGMLTANEYAVELNKMLCDMHEMIINEMSYEEDCNFSTNHRIEELEDEMWDLEEEKEELETKVEDLEYLVKDIKEITQSHVSKSINNGVTPVKSICRINDTIVEWEKDNYNIK